MKNILHSKSFRLNLLLIHMRFIHTAINEPHQFKSQKKLILFDQLIVVNHLHFDTVFRHPVNCTILELNYQIKQISIKSNNFP